MQNLENIGVTAGAVSHFGTEQAFWSLVRRGPGQIVKDQILSCR
jgi:hypothetical protein